MPAPWPPDECLAREVRLPMQHPVVEAAIWGLVDASDKERRPARVADLAANVPASHRGIRVADDHLIGPCRATAGDDQMRAEVSPPDQRERLLERPCGARCLNRVDRRREDPRDHGRSEITVKFSGQLGFQSRQRCRDGAGRGNLESAAEEGHACRRERVGEDRLLSRLVVDRPGRCGASGYDRNPEDNHGRPRTAGKTSKAGGEDKSDARERLADMPPWPPQPPGRLSIKRGKSLPAGVRYLRASRRVGSRARGGPHLPNHPPSTGTIAP